jgi:membrane fusion protein (multidrug efflux system)
MTTASPEASVPRMATGRGWLRAFVTLGMAALFTAGITYLMMTLAGYFEPKVKPGPVATSDQPAAAAENFAEVKLVKRLMTESAVGTIRALHEAVVASKILARVKEVKIKAGQTVEADDELVVLDDADLQARLQQAHAAESGASAKLIQARTDVERSRRLRAVNSVSQQELEQANTAYLAAKAELERTQQAVNEAQIQQGYASIRAPIRGVIVDKKVNPGDTVSPGQALLTMYDRERMQMVATVRESLAMGLKVGQQVAARLDALDLDCHAMISEIVPEAHAESRSFLVKVTGPCPPNVYSGMFGRIFIPLGEEEVLVVPPQAVRKVGQLDEVDVVGNGITRRHVVQLGRTLPEGREVLSGLKAGERVLMPRKSTGREACS